jgi:glycosyltransferase involved in cell wall biosynthesis
VRRKRVLLAGARCLIVSSVIAETSSLVAMEALACGTPVVALRRGALEDVVEHGVTGFVVDDVASMTAAIRAVSTIDRRACRAAAESRFDGRVMARAYLETYARIARFAHAGEPCST